MEAGTLTRGARRRLAALVALAGTTPAVARGAEPGPFPLAVPVPPPAVEVYYGTNKVAPPPAPVVVRPPAPAPAPVAPAAAVVSPRYVEEARPGQALVETLRAMRDGTRTVSAATASLLTKVGDRLMNPPEPRQIVLTNYIPPQPPDYYWPTAAAPAPAPSQPTVVVIREPAGETRPATAAEPARGVTLGVETIVALAFAVAGLAFGLIAWARGSRKAEPPVVAPPVVVPPPAESNGVKLMGKYDAGPLPETAEKFDLGPSYHDEKQQQKQTEEANHQAAVEFILNQNLALLAALNPGAAIDAPELDADGFAIPVDHPEPVGGVPAPAVA